MAARIDLTAVMQAMPCGLAVYDHRRRLIFINPAFCRTMGLPGDLFGPGASVEEVARIAAHHGVFGPGDPDVLAAQMLAHDDRTTRRYARRRPDGGTYEAHYIPLDTGYMVFVSDTTQLMALRDSAEQGTRRVQQAMAHLRVGLAVFGPDRTLGLHNRRFLQLLGLDLAPPPAGAPFRDVLGAAARGSDFASPEGARFITAQRAQDRSRPGQTTWRRADGTVIELQSDPLASGGWTMTVLDITAQANAEAEVQRRVATLHSIIANMPSGVVVFDSDCRLALTNDSYRAVMKGAAGSVGELDSDMVRRQAEMGEFGPGDPEVIWHHRMAELDNARRTVNRRRRPTGQTVEVRAATLPDGGIVRVLTDVSAAVAAEEERACQAALMATMLSHIQHGIVLWDHDQRIVAANSVVTNLLGAEPGLMVPGTTLEQTIEAATRRGNFGHGPNALMWGEVLRQRDRTISHLDQRMTLDGRVLEVRSDPAPGGSFVTTYTDVTAIRSAEAALKESRAAAEQASLSKSAFLAAMSHDLRRPLMMMIEQAGAIGRTPDPGHTAAAVQQAGTELLARLDSILDVARLEAGRFDLAEQPVAVGPLIRDALVYADAAAAAAEITLTATIASPEPIVTADRRRLLQALNDLIRYALMMAPPLSTIDVAAALDVGDLVLTITAATVVLDPTTVSRAFEPFDSDPGGTAPAAVLRLALHISRLIMQAHGGTAEMVSTSACGTVATLRLPASRLQVSLPSPERDWSAPAVSV